MANDTWRPHGSEDYVHAFNQLLPIGQAWTRDPTSYQQLFYTGLNNYWGAVDASAAQLLTVESDPRTTLVLLPDWLRAWGLPDPCVAEPLTTQDLRNALVTKMTMLGGQSIAFFTNLAATLGYTISIREYSPYMCGVSRCGDTRAQYDGVHYRWTLGPPTKRFIWTVAVTGTRYTKFHVSIGQCGIDRLLSIGLATDLQCLFERYKPAQTYVVFDYSGMPPTKMVQHNAL